MPPPTLSGSGHDRRRLHPRGPADRRGRRGRRRAARDLDATQALDAGYRSVLWRRASSARARCAGPGACSRASALRRAAGFDQGNSPRGGDAARAATSWSSPRRTARRRSSPRLAMPRRAGRVPAQPRRRRSPPWMAADVQVVCSGTDGAVALEDVYVAGRICAQPARAADRRRARGGGCRARVPDAARGAGGERRARGAARRGPRRGHRADAPASPRSTSSGGCRPARRASRA